MRPSPRPPCSRSSYCLPPGRFMRRNPHRTSRLIDSNLEKLESLIRGEGFL
jgi:hypothetical protein